MPSLRRLFALTHAWLGALSAVFVILVAASGAGLAFMSELFLAQYGAMLRAAPPTPDARMVDLDAMLASAQAGYGQPLAPIGVLLPHSRVPGIETAAPFGLPAGAAGFEDLRMISIDPWTGAYRGDFRLNDALGHKLVHFHQELFAGPLGASLVAALGLLLAVFAVTGVWLWWPRRGSALAKAGRLDLAGGPKRAFFQLHGWLGVWTAAAIVLFSLSGTAISRPHWLGLPTAPEAPPLSAGFARTCPGAVSPGEAARAAAAAYPNRTLKTLYFPQSPGGPYRLTLHAADDLDRLHGDLLVFAHARCAGLLYGVDLGAASVAARAHTISHSVHGGYTFGPLAGDALVLLAGLGLLVLAASGLVVFFTRTLRLKL